MTTIFKYEQFMNNVRIFPLTPFARNEFSRLKIFDCFAMTDGSIRLISAPGSTIVANLQAWGHLRILEIKLFLKILMFCK